MRPVLSAENILVPVYNKKQVKNKTLFIKTSHRSAFIHIPCRGLRLWALLRHPSGDALQCTVRLLHVWKDTKLKIQNSTFRVKTNCVDEAAVTLKLLQQLAVHITHIESPHSYHTVVAPCHHQVLGAGMVLSAVHKGRMSEHLLGCSLKPLYIPLSKGGEWEGEDVKCKSRTKQKHAVTSARKALWVTYHKRGAYALYCRTKNPDVTAIQ